MSESEVKKRRPIREGLLTSIENDGKLLGSKCNDCHQVYFPSLGQNCFKCLSENLSVIELSSQGKLYSYATCMVPTKRYKPPYVTGFVELPEGVRIFCQMEQGGLAENLKVGMQVNLNVATLWETEEEEVVAYRFSPA